MAHLKALGRFALQAMRATVENKGRFGDELFLGAAYRALLRREPETREIQSRLQELASTASRVDILRSIIQSNEYAQLYATPSSLIVVQREYNVTGVVKYLVDYDFSIIVDPRDTGVGLPLLEGDVYEKHVTDELLRYLKPDTRFLDIGANIGYYSLLVASRCPEGRIYSFEPDLRNFRFLKANIAYNGFEPVICAYDCAVSDENAQLTISDLGNAPNWGARFTAKNEGTLRAGVHGPDPYFRKVKAVALDSFLQEKHIDLIKIDIEGYEPFALRGMVSLIRRDKPVIFAEFAPPNLTGLAGTEPEAFLQFFTDLDYELNVITLEGELERFGRDITGPMVYYQMQNTHHLDLVLAPREDQDA